MIVVGIYAQNHLSSLNTEAQAVINQQMTVGLLPHDGQLPTSNVIKLPKHTENTIVVEPTASYQEKKAVVISTYQLTDPREGALN
jgi:hypothetical protein